MSRTLRRRLVSATTVLTVLVDPLPRAAGKRSTGRRVPGPGRRPRPARHRRFREGRPRRRPLHGRTDRTGRRPRRQGLLHQPGHQRRRWPGPPLQPGDQVHHSGPDPGAGRPLRGRPDRHHPAPELRDQPLGLPLLLAEGHPTGQPDQSVHLQPVHAAARPGQRGRAHRVAHRTRSLLSLGRLDELGHRRQPVLRRRRQHQLRRRLRRDGPDRRADQPQRRSTTPSAPRATPTTCAERSTGSTRRTTAATPSPPATSSPPAPRERARRST